MNPSRLSRYQNPATAPVAILRKTEKCPVEALRPMFCSHCCTIILDGERCPYCQRMAQIFLPPPGSTHKADDLAEAMRQPERFGEWLLQERKKLQTAREILGDDPDQQALLTAFGRWEEALEAAALWAQQPNERERDNCTVLAGLADVEITAALFKEWQVTRDTLFVKQQELRWSGYEPPPPLNPPSRRPDRP